MILHTIYKFKYTEYISDFVYILEIDELLPVNSIDVYFGIQS